MKRWEAEPIFEAIFLEFQGLCEEWIELLYWLIQEARNKCVGKKAQNSYEYDTYGVNLTFRTFMQTIEQEPGWAKKEVEQEQEEKREIEEKPLPICIAP
ncbi:hypothetical protein H1R20_g2847, partial [Candolleomyces eurysporus]